jgi:hypothetical protein
MVVLVLEDAETTPSLVKVVGRTLVATGSAGTSSLENVYERIADSGILIIATVFG